MVDSRNQLIRKNFEQNKLKYFLKTNYVDLTLIKKQLLKLVVLINGTQKQLVELKRLNYINY